MLVAGEERKGLASAGVGTGAAAGTGRGLTGAAGGGSAD